MISNYNTTHTNLRVRNLDDDHGINKGAQNIWQENSNEEEAE